MSSAFWTVELADGNCEGYETRGLFSSPEDAATAARSMAQSEREGLVEVAPDGWYYSVAQEEMGISAVVWYTDDRDPELVTRYMPVRCKPGEVAELGGVA